MTSNIDDLSKLLKDYSNIASSFIEQQDFESALEPLNRCKDVLAIYEEQGKSIETYHWVEAFHNSALCYQR